MRKHIPPQSKVFSALFIPAEYKNQKLRLLSRVYILSLLVSVILNQAGYSQDATPPYFDKNENRETERSYVLNLNAWVYLESAMIDPGGSGAYSLPMRTTLNNLNLLPGQSYLSNFSGIIYTPAAQIYSTMPWLYHGNEWLAFDSYGNPAAGCANYESTIVDWVLVSFRGTPDGLTICNKAGLLHNDGYIEFPEGGFTCTELSNYNSLYVVIEHTNHLIVMSDQPVPVINNTVTYDFRYMQSYIYNPNEFGGYGQKEVLPGIFAMFAGNNDQSQTPFSDTDINFDDMNYWGDNNGNTGLNNISDFNMDGDCNYDDRIIWESNNGVFSTVPRD